MSELVRLENWRYHMDMGCGGDFWLLGGQVYNHPKFNDGEHITTSTPVKLSGVLLTTASGRQYTLGVCGGNLEEQLGYIQEDISRGGTLIQ